MHCTITKLRATIYAAKVYFASVGNVQFTATDVHSRKTLPNLAELKLLQKTSRNIKRLQ